MARLKDFLGSTYLNQLEALHLPFNSHSSTGYAGIRRSRVTGQSVEFADFREYTPGDDVRRLDWRSYGRFDKLFIKRFADERQAAVHLFLDKSQSMDNAEAEGKANKFNYARLLAASIAYIALKHSDNVHVYCCDEKISLRFRRLSSKKQFPELVDFLDGVEPSGETRLTDALAGTHGLATGISYVFSDFFTPDADRCMHALCSQRQDVTLVHILSAREIRPDLSGELRLTDSEDGSYQDIEITEAVLTAYDEALRRHCGQIKAACSKRGARYLYAPAGEDVFDLDIFQK